jgi:chemotaxis protein methyltransferase CheR
MSLLSEKNAGLPATAHFLGEDVDADTLEEARQVLLQLRNFDLHMYKDGCIRRRIAARVRACGFHHPRPYLEMLVRTPAEVDALMAAVTVQVSEFFRNPSTYDLLLEQVIPELFRRIREQGGRNLRVWSVGCAGGEEPYSLAMLLDQVLPPGMRFGIRATDINPQVLDQARQAVFDPRRMSQVPDAWRDRYFVPQGKGYRLREDVRAAVRFEQHNILAAQDEPQADLIVCRNVLIYFSRFQQERVLQTLARALPAGGVLVLGRAETLIEESRTLFSIVNPAERIFIRSSKTRAATPAPRIESNEGQEQN